MKQRVLINSLILVAFFLLPWWFSALMVFASLFLIRNFWEIILWGFVFDIFHGIHGGGYNTFYWGTVIALTLYTISLPLQKRISIS